MKAKLFEATYKAVTEYCEASRTGAASVSGRGELYGRFCSLWELVEELDLADEYTEWKQDR